ncbi:MAG: DUF3108 domain-containing protein [Deinococcota bacterium]|nr:DUF3108 domain-containing protein [Deinococcota bacterium]
MSLASSLATSLATAVEVCSYRLNIRGKPAGSQTLRTLLQGRRVELEAKLTLQGALGQQTVTQSSSLRAPSLTSLRFSETLIDHHDKRHYQVDFDEASGLVRASRGPKDSAEIPYSRPYRDPLGLLYLIRCLSAEARSVRVPMLGKDVVIERLPDAALRTALGDREARVYALYPGLSYVYVDAASPHAILKLSQRFESGLLDALIVKVSEEDAPLTAEAKPSRDRGAKRRNRRGNRRRLPKRGH